MRLVKTAKDAYDIVDGDRVLGEVVEAVDGRWIVSINGFQWGRGEPDRAGAYNETFATPEDGLNAYRASHNPQQEL